ncbi:MAG: hypothetical protein SWC96_10690 [Thermodesulfobacteriota bacterium]|nr:hypothetical protein [Thermodesulfobacteriota bacterium]
MAGEDTMVYILIALFFTSLFFFFFFSGLWHWVWYGRGADRCGRLLAYRIFWFRQKGEAGLPTAQRFARVFSTLLVLAAVTALGLVTYLMIS